MYRERSHTLVHVRHQFRPPVEESAELENRGNFFYHATETINKICSLNFIELINKVLRIYVTIPRGFFTRT